MEDVTVTVAETLDDEIEVALARLLPQLSGSEESDSDAIARVVGDDATSLLLARIGERIVGTLTLAVFSLPSGLRAHIDDVVVDEAGRGRGVGEALVKAALAEAERLGVRAIDLTTLPSREAAIRLYTRSGFARQDWYVFRYTPDGGRQT